MLLHFGTLGSVIYVFRDDFVNLLRFRREEKQKNMLFMLLIGVIPTALMGLFLRSYSEMLFQSIILVGFMLLITGTILKVLTVLTIGSKGIAEIKVKDALWVGLYQGMAILPGISRSGSTILASLWRGFDRETAVRYSFMLSAPVIFGATLLESREMMVSGIEKNMLFSYIIGGLISFIFGVIAIKLFMKLLNNQRFIYFAYYCWTIGAVVIIYALLNRF